MKRDRIATKKELESSLKNDSLGRNSYLANLLQMLTTISEHTVLALDGNWGSGKTFFIKQLEYLSTKPANYANINKDSIEKFNNLYSVFYFNAWENDHLPPLESLLLQMSNGIWDTTEELGNMVMGLVKNIVNIPVKYFSGGSADLESLKDTYISQYIEHADKISKSSNEINNILHNYKEKMQRKVLFIIDDLDRCKPTFAVELLETIKHNFNSNDAVFLICANNRQLQHTIKKYYGNDFNGYEYLDRFYDLIINLPEPDIENYIEYQLQLKNVDYGYNSVAIDIAKIEHMSLRQINRYISSMELLEDFLGSNSLGSEARYDTCTKNVFIQIACALKLLDAKKFNDFTTGNGDYILDEYMKKSEEIKSFADGEPPIKTCYKELFNLHGSHYRNSDAFKKAVSSIGFSTIIDTKPESTEVQH